MPWDKPIVAIATGDPAGIGPEISLKAALDPAVRAACHPILVSDPALLGRHAGPCGIALDLHVIERFNDADRSGQRLQVLACRQPEASAMALGKVSAAAGRASIAFCGTAVRAALAGEVDAVVAAPQNETSIAMAGIPFDGHPSFVARETGTDVDDVFLMLCFGETKISHVTLHRSVRQAVEAITRERVGRAIKATDAALRRLGIEAPKICVGGLNPHAGEGGLFGREEIEIITPAVEAAVAEGLTVEGPFGADTLFHRPGVDAFLVMLHDQGHIAAKLLARHAAAAVTIGTPVLFASVAHGSAHDIAGTGVADATAMIEAVLGCRPCSLCASPSPESSSARITASLPLAFLRPKRLGCRKTCREDATCAVH
jgi:4-hydroxythreonine-4-phosphate dehydrogenase